jgi:hypothetical protein|nr:MAG TPA: hypothetical protein [Caudoviricetes sp.]
MAEVIPQINIDGTKIKNTWTEKEYVTDEVYNALNKAVIDLKNNNNLLDSNSILFREEYNSSSKNLNNAIHQGVYSFTNSAVNAPSGVTGGNLFVTNTSKINQGSSVITQIAFCHNGAVYARTKNNSENFTSWNKLAYITDNVASATKATQDSDGNAINTTYVKKVNGTADGLTCVDDTFGGQLTVKRNSKNATTIKFTNTSNVNRYIGFSGSDKVMYRWGDNGENQTVFLDSSNYNNYAPTKTGGGASGTWGININGTAKKINNTATDGSAIDLITGKMAINDYFRIRIGGKEDSGYAEIATADNGKEPIYIRQYVDFSDTPIRTATILDGSGNTSFPGKVTASGGFSGNLTGNATSATKATQDKNGLQIDTNYLKRSGGTITGQLTMGTGAEVQIKAPNNTGFYFNSGALGCYNWSDTNGGTIFDYSPSRNTFTFGKNVTAPTPGTSDNSTRVATTAFVHSLLNRAVGKTQPTLTGLIDWEAMKSANGGTDVRNIKNTRTGITAYGGDVRALNNGDIILKQAFTKFDALLIKYTDDTGWWNKTVIIPIWEFNIMFNTKGYFQLLKEETQYWTVGGNACVEVIPSTTTRFNVRKQNCGIIEIYGVTY